jgi:SAM-dependent methyltransferase
MRPCSFSFLLLLGLTSTSQAFAPAKGFALKARTSQPSSLVRPVSSKTTTRLSMGLDFVTFMRTEWVSAAICANQTPRSADVCLELGSLDGRTVSFIPKTVREFITSSAEPDGMLTVTARRQLKQQQQIKGENTAQVKYVDQAADDLSETASESVDVVYSLQAAARLQENGRDWKRSVREAARVLKPGGRFLFVEQTVLAGGESYLEYVQTLLATTDEDSAGDAADDDEDEMETRFAVFSEVGFDPVDMVLEPHIAGVATKSLDAGMTPAERAQRAALEQKDRVAELSLVAFERGHKKRKKKKKSTEAVDADTTKA